MSAPPASTTPAPSDAAPAVAAVSPVDKNAERTFIAVKPDGVQRRLVGRIIKRFEDRGFTLVGLKMVRPSDALARQHYADLSSKGFFAGLINFFTSGPVVAMCWQGPNVVKVGRMMLGETRPQDSLPGSIRGDYCVDVGRNIIHGSDSVESAQAELALWFPEGFPEPAAADRSSQSWLLE
eukprot:gnl/Spiro4/8440_TR4433_c0_g1_i1.p2 gnl/Spiro4/8440_TR4433_c0_g1~~gnl/Spiro4/8440_TR4433_c0_g1_i1.p2  ORF type:complete len:192 (+),score=43.46 gnl/Spiro4/8440_TR4433_c0_g1_i1:39-578(+)